MFATIPSMITVGIDEVGRGCWAGPLVAGAVILPRNAALKLIWEDCPPKGERTKIKAVRLADSKKLSKGQREVAREWIQSNALAVGLGWVWPTEIDTHGITWAVKAAMERALAEITLKYDEIIIDGNINYLAHNSKTRAIIKADDSVPAVSAASIVAKVARDRYMTELDEQYSGYGFAKHVGYGTAAHSVALKMLGVSDIHRQSYKPIQAFLV